MKKISTEILNKVNKSIQRNNKSYTKYGSREDHLMGFISVTAMSDYYYVERLHVKDINTYKKSIYVNSPLVVDYVKVAKHYKQLNLQLFRDMNNAEWLAIRPIIISQIRFYSVEDYRLFIDMILSFGFKDDWPDWISFSQDRCFYKITKETKFNNSDFKLEYERLMYSQNVPKWLVDKHLTPAYSRFKA